MSCPDWTNLVERRDRDDEGEVLWEQALAHLGECPRCHEAAYAAEPTLLFRRLPAPETSAEDVEAMKKAVAALRRAQPMVVPASGERRRARRARSRSAAVWLRSAAMAAVALGAALVYGLLGGEGAAPGNANEPVRFEIQVLRASKHDLGGPTLRVSELAPELAAELDEVLRYEHYQVIAEADVDTVEGETTSSELGGGFEVSFKTGSLEEGGHLLLEDFTIRKKAAVKGRQVSSGPILRSLLELELGEPATLFVGNLNQEDLLVVAVTFHTEESGR